MPELTEYETDAAVLADLATKAQHVTELDGEAGPFFTVDSDGEARLVDVEAFRAHPRRTVATRQFADVPSLLAYLQRHDPRPMEADSSGNTILGHPSRFSEDFGAADPDEGPVTVWASEKSRSVTAVLDDSTASTPGWGGHRATVTMERDEDWVKWVNRNNQLMSQEPAAEFIEDLVHTIVEPDAADLLEIVSTLQIHRQMVVGRTVRLSSGETQISYSDEDAATAGRAGQATLTVPNRIVLSVPVFVGAAPVEVSARFRYRQVGRELKVAYVIDRLRLVEREAFAAVVAQIADAGRPVLFGAP